ncbi:Non-specific serine/threonine protein kinase [Bertholletia excelsa]
MGTCFSCEDPKHVPQAGTPGSRGRKSAGAISATPKNVMDLRQNPGYSNVDIFTYEEMKLATKHFQPDQVLGEGRFGIAYKGVINENVRPGYESTQVAVKELYPEGIQGEREWLAKVNYLGQLRHPNLVKLVGYCCEDDHRLLVYEYMASGSLEKHHFHRECATLTWSKRMKIALDAAKGLAFLHGAERSIIFRDFKTSNILLDADFNAKLSNFGLAKDGPRDDHTHVAPHVKYASYSYAAPEDVMTAHSRSDVYGFGVVLLEILIGRKAVDKSRPRGEHNLVEWARPLLNHNKELLRILDPRMQGQYSTETAQKVANLAYRCLSQNPKGRPVMSQVVETLETLQAQDETREEAMFQSGAGSITLYEVPKVANDTSREKRYSLRSEKKERRRGRIH